MENAIASRPRCLRIHRDLLLQVFGGLFQRELAEREFNVYLHPQRAQAHEIVNDLTSVRAIIKQAGLEHHFLGIKANPFVGTGVQSAL